MKVVGNHSYVVHERAVVGTIPLVVGSSMVVVGPWAVEGSGVRIMPKDRDAAEKAWGAMTSGSPSRQCWTRSTAMAFAVVVAVAILIT